MGKKGNTKIAPYMVFVNEYMRDNNEPNRDKAMNACSPLWNSMNEDQRRPYIEEASNRTMTNRARQIEVLTQHNESASQQAQRETIYLPELRKSLCENFVRTSNKMDIINKDIYIISFNVMVKTYEGEYIPLEVGLVQYSLRDGIKKTYHEFIDGGEIPTGYAKDAKEHMEQYHKIPLKDFSLSIGQQDAQNIQSEIENRKQAFDTVVKRIDEFIQGERVYKNEQDKEGVRPIFTFPDDNEAGILQATGCLKKLALETGRRDFFESIVVLDLAYLLFNIYKLSGLPTRPLALCCDDLNRTIFDYEKDVDCEYHEQIDCIHCALGKSKRSAFMISDILCGPFGIEATRKHLPNIHDRKDVVYEMYDPQLKVKHPNYYSEQSKDTLIPISQPNAWAARATSSVSASSSSTMQTKPSVPPCAQTSGGSSITSEIDLLAQESFPSLNISNPSQSAPLQPEPKNETQKKVIKGLGRGHRLRKQ